MLCVSAAVCGAASGNWQCGMQQHLTKRQHADRSVDGHTVAAAPDNAAVSLLVCVLAGNQVTPQCQQRCVISVPLLAL